MAKTKSKQKTTTPLYEKKFNQLRDTFPQITVKMWSDMNPGKAGKDFIMEINLPDKFKLIRKVVATNGEITVIAFSVQKKHCTGSQKPGVYVFSA